MADALDPEGLLRAIAGFTPVARVVLATTGTLQSTLSAYFATPVLVRVVDQQKEGDGLYRRRTELYRKDTGEVLCAASSLLEVGRHDVRELVEARVHGLGQLLTLLDLATTFSLVDVGNDGRLWRRYRLWGEGFSFTITEQFDTEAFPALSP